MAMMLGVMVVGAGATQFSDDAQIQNQEAVDMCVALSIIGGYPDGSYKPANNITRAEFCKMMAVMLNGGKEPATATNATPSFTDIGGNWAEGYIEYCYAKGIVSGVGGGKFNPAGNITATEGAKMLLVALGYNAEVEGYVGASWALYVNVQANQDGLYKDLEDIDTGAALSRDNAAQMIWNTLQAMIINKTSTIDRTDGSVTDSYTPSTTTDLLEKAYGAETSDPAVMTGFTYNSTKDKWTYTFGQGESFTTAKDFTSLYGQIVTVVSKGSTVYGMYADAEDCQVIATGIYGDLDFSDKEPSVKIDGTSYDLEDGCYVAYFMHGAYSLEPINDEGSLDPFAYTAIDYDADDTIDLIVVVPFAVGQVSLKNTTKVALKDLEKSDVVAVSDGNNETLILEDITVYDGIAKNDYVVYTPKQFTVDNTATIVKAETVIDGTVARVAGDDITIDGTVYTNLTGTDLKAGDKLTDTVVVNGYMFLTDAAGTVNANDYVVLVKYADNTGTMNGPQAKLLMADGTKKVVDLKKDQSLTVGDLYTYTINSDDEYVLTPAVVEVEEGDDVAALTGFDKISAADADPVLNSSNKVKYIGDDKDNIADDAVIFVYDQDDYSVITGAQLKTLNGEEMTVVAAYANDSSSTGYSTVVMAYVVNGEALKTADTSYGYVVAKVASVQNADEDIVNEIQLWNGTEVVTLKTTDKNVGADLAKADVVEYTVNADGDIDEINVVGDAVAITAYDGTYICVNEVPDRLEITDDTVIYYIDNDEVEGATDGTISLATKNIVGEVEYYVQNAIVVVNSDDEVELLVIDINNDLNGDL